MSTSINRSALYITEHCGMLQGCAYTVWCCVAILFLNVAFHNKTIVQVNYTASIEDQSLFKHKGGISQILCLKFLTDLCSVLFSQIRNHPDFQTKSRSQTVTNPMELMDDFLSISV